MKVPASRSVTSFRPSARTIGSSNSRDHFGALMAPALPVDLGLEAFGQARPGRVIRRIASRARCPWSAAGTGVFAFPWLVQMPLTDPAAVLTEAAFHG
jgi:hypothetical protein